MEFDPKPAVASSPPRQVFARSGRIINLDWSPDGIWIVLGESGRRDEIFLIRSDDGGYRQLVEDSFRNRIPRFAPDGTRIGFYSDRGGAYGLWSIRTHGSGLQPLAPPLPQGSVHTLWSPDGRRMATTDGSSIFILDLERPFADRLIQTLPVTDPDFVNFDLCDRSPDATALALVGPAPGGTSRLFAYALASRALTRLAAGVEWARWLRDGRRLVATYGNRLFLLDGVTGTTRDLLPPGRFPPHSILTAAISRDDRHIAFIEQTLDGDIWAMTLP